MSSIPTETAGPKPERAAAFAPLKRVAPKSLLGRTLAILLTPIAVIILVATYIFYESPWEGSTRRLAQLLAGDILMIAEALRTFPEEDQQARIIRLAETHTQLEFRLMQAERLHGTQKTHGNFFERTVRAALAESIHHPFEFDAATHADKILIRIDIGGAVLHVAAPRKRVQSPAVLTFFVWLIGTAGVLAIIGVLFMRNQVRPIRQLALAAEALGKGQDVPDFHAHGATEVRQAAAAFLTMRGRIRRQMRQRTEMLAGVSHDLRTPLTRMKLQLAMLGTGEDIQNLKSDVVEMERMIEAYLAFAKGAEGEAAKPTDIAIMLADIAADAARQGGTVENATAAGADLVLAVRPIAIKRCIVNLVDNARRYSKRVRVGATRHADRIEIAVDDDGPGIPFSKREIVFRAFFRLDASRNPESGGTGLGLSIARDIARSHGGNLTLGDSDLGGLRALLSLPL
jgi:two-component system osmolarity sensor histidine kinase EnvZ